MSYSSLPTLFIRLIKISILSFLLLTSLNLSTVSAAPESEVTVLIYHRFGEDKYPTTNVGVERFREQMAYLLANNYRVISLDALVDSLAGKKTLPPKAVVITIDDGFKSVYNEAWPVLKSFGFPFTVFIYINGIEKGFNDYMTWDEVREMAEAGVDIQDHSYSHGRMADKPAGMDDDQYRNWISGDLIRSSRIMIEKLGKKPHFFAIPYGEYNQQVMEEAREIGYKAILTQDPGSVSNYTDRLMIPREPILGNDWSTMKHFEQILHRVDLPLTDIKPAYGAVKGAPESYGAKILEPDRYLPASFEVYVSELGWLKASVKNGVVSAPGGKKLKRRLNRVMVKARKKGGGRTAVRSWLLMNDQLD